ncbi:Phosphatidylglycerol--membrane-oligosaccharide glycerophosphotransferase [Lentibacillus sp. JNUCC-1]|uniref:LTA synthase family protein n=1 Tax=Lentibacillus sp. JNUCC-1 TaxID=2654513 RepID=UPI0012E70B5F|nr:LTA synthase family protein [Lentibacillus sp. JNUCC-1]MUV36550.1 Phosphatidylglycerol--membrane-oligosaccharide glycerophosphotransferase [Lentibacillus sp. JNUCC-1]
MNRLIPYLSNHLIGVTVMALLLKTVLVTLISFHAPVTTWYDVVLLIIGPLGTIMLFVGISFLFTRLMRPWLLITAYVIVTGLLYANVLYYRFYIDFVTVPVLFQLSNVGGLGPSTVELLSPWDPFLVLDLILIIYLMKRKRKHHTPFYTPNKKSYTFTAFATIAITFALALMQTPYLLKVDYDRELLVTSLGLYNYQFVNIATSIKVPIEKAMADEGEAKAANKKLTRTEEEETDLFGVAEDKNVIIISLESTQGFVIDEDVNGESITPFMNELIEDSFYFSNIYDQTAQGKTSDAEFMISTGLYPLPSGSAFVRYPKNTYQSLPKILQEAGGYQAYSFHANDRTFWNREEMYTALGYEEFFSKRDYKVTEENSVNYGLKDIPFYEQSMEMLKDLPEPYLAKFLMLTNHFPFLLEEEDQFIDKANTDLEVVNRYMTTVRYEDEALKRFFELLKEANMYEDNIFVIYGDHYGISKQYEEGVHQFLDEKDTPLNHLALQRIPLIIHVPGQEGREIDITGGQIDIRATLLHLLGVDDRNNMSLSRNLLTRSGDHPVVFRDGGFVTENYAYIERGCYNREQEKKVSQSKCTPYLKQARDELRISDHLIQRDLLRFLE